MVTIGLFSTYCAHTQKVWIKSIAYFTRAEIIMSFECGLLIFYNVDSAHIAANEQ